MIVEWNSVHIAMESPHLFQTMRLRRCLCHCCCLSMRRSCCCCCCCRPILPKKKINCKFSVIVSFCSPTKASTCVSRLFRVVCTHSTCTYASFYICVCVYILYKAIRMFSLHASVCVCVCVSCYLFSVDFVVLVLFAWGSLQFLFLFCVSSSLLILVVSCCCCFAATPNYAHTHTHTRWVRIANAHACSCKSSTKALYYVAIRNLWVSVCLCVWPACKAF